MEDKIVKKITIAATALALVASVISVAPAQAADVAAAKARYGDACATTNATASNKGADGSDLICGVETGGTHKGKKIWKYIKFPTIKSLDILMAGGVGGGYDQFGRTIGAALKSEGILTGEPTYRNMSGAGGSTGLASFLNNNSNESGKALVTGFAMIGGVQSVKATVRTSQTVAAARMMAEYEVVVVPASSTIKDMKGLFAAIKKGPKTFPFAGGNLGGIDHYTVAKLYNSQKIATKDLNYLVYSGGAQTAASLLSGTAKAGIAGWGEFASFVEAGKLRVIGISSPTAVAGIPAKTFTSQGFKVTTANWRGIQLPAGTPPAAQELVQRALDVVRASKFWNDYRAEWKWADNFLATTAYGKFIDSEEAAIKKLYTDLGL